MKTLLYKIKNYLRNNAFSVILFVAFIFTYVNSDARSFLSQQVLKTGIFNPRIEKQQNEPKVVTSADILFKDKDGQTVSLKSLEGKVVFINLWATWCPPCIAEMPSIQKLYNEIGEQNIVFLMVDVDNQQNRSQKFMDKKGFNLPIYTPASVIPENIFDGTIPTTLILDKQGRKVMLHKGMANYADKDLVAHLKELSK